MMSKHFYYLLLVLCFLQNTFGSEEVNEEKIMLQNESKDLSSITHVSDFYDLSYEIDEANLHQDEINQLENYFNLINFTDKEKIQDDSSTKDLASTDFSSTHENDDNDSLTKQELTNELNQHLNKLDQAANDFIDDEKMEDNSTDLSSQMKDMFQSLADDLNELNEYLKSRENIIIRLIRMEEKNFIQRLLDQISDPTRSKENQSTKEKKITKARYDFKILANIKDKWEKYQQHPENVSRRADHIREIMENVLQFQLANLNKLVSNKQLQIQNKSVSSSTQANEHKDKLKKHDQENNTAFSKNPEELNQQLDQFLDELDELARNATSDKTKENDTIQTRQSLDQIKEYLHDRETKITLFKKYLTTWENIATRLIREEEEKLIHQLLDQLSDPKRNKENQLTKKEKEEKTRADFNSLADIKDKWIKYQQSAVKLYLRPQKIRDIIEEVLQFQLIHLSNRITYKKIQIEQRQNNAGKKTVITQNKKILSKKINQKKI